MVRKRVWSVLCILFGIVLTLSFVSAFDFNGTVYDESGMALNNSLVNITFRQNSDFSVVGSNFSYTNESGYFNFTVTKDSDYQYEIKITQRNSTSDYVQWVGQNLPSLPYQEVINLAGTKFYLRRAGTLNITAINSTGARIPFQYQIKDTKLGYPIAEEFSNSGQESIIYLPKERNYSIMIFPDGSMPVSFEWANFSSDTSYSFANGISNYNATTETLSKQFNTTMGFVRIFGNFTHSDAAGWDDFSIVSYILEPGDMVHVDHGELPYNLSAFFDAANPSDLYDLSTGYFNISLPSTVENSEMILFATARNGSRHYGGFLNVSYDLTSVASGSAYQTNISSYDLLGGAVNLSIQNIQESSYVNISSAKQSLNVINSSGGYLGGAFVHAELTVDYSLYGSKEFTWMSDVQQGSSSIIQIPLLNVTGIKETDIFASGGNYAPKSTLFTYKQVQTVQNITLGTFNPGDIDDPTDKTGLKIALFTSNSSCDVPSPSNNCAIGASGDANGQDFGNFNPIQAVMGGGKISFRMGLISSGIIVHYVNVDMLASGPPDALFDDSATTSTSGSYESAFRFGSQGPKIYDYVLISMPYTPGSSSQTGINESAQINVSIPTLYDDNWNAIWTTGTNGTDAGALANNDSHYQGREGEWAFLLNGTICHENANAINQSNPCYIDKTNNRVWVRIPHFSGTGPTLDGSVITADEGEDSSSSSSSGGGAGTTSPNYWEKTYSHSDQNLEKKGVLVRALQEKYRMKIKIEGEIHYVGVIDIKSDKVTINVSSDPQQTILKKGESEKFEVTNDNYYDLEVTLIDIINSNLANVSVKAIYEKVPENMIVGGSDGESGSVGTNGENITNGNQTGVGDGESSGNLWITIIVILIVLLMGVGFAYWWFFMKEHQPGHKHMNKKMRPPKLPKMPKGKK